MRVGTIFNRRHTLVMHAYDNWKNPMKDVTDLIGQLEALTVVKYSLRWYDIVERNRRHTLDKKETNRKTAKD